MKEFMYLLFFGIMNFLFFYFNTKKIELSYKLRIVFALILVLILILHFFQIENISIDNQSFFHLIIISLISFVIHYGGELSIILIKKFDPNLQDNFVISVFNFIRFYVFYLFIYFYQSIFIISNR